MGTFIRMKGAITLMAFIAVVVPQSYLHTLTRQVKYECSRSMRSSLCVEAKNDLRAAQNPYRPFRVSGA